MASYSFPDRDQPPSNNPTRGQLLKDLLQHDDYSSSSSSSSSGFTSIPRFLSSSTPHVIKSPNDRPHSAPPPAPAITSLRRSRSRSQVAADATISLIQKLLTAVVKSPLPRRSWSDRRRKRRNRTCENGKPTMEGVVEESDAAAVGVRLRVKDILRWESFKDLVVIEHEDDRGVSSDEEEMKISSETWSTPLDVAPDTPDIDTLSELSSVVNDDDDDAHTTDEESVGLSSSRFGGAGAGGRSWDSAGTGGKVHSPEGSTNAAPKPKDELIHHPFSGDHQYDDHQHSPVSVLNSPFRDNNNDDEDTSSTSTSMSTFEESMASVERTKQRLLDSIKWFETLAAGVDSINNPFTDDEDDEEGAYNQAVVLDSAEVDDFRETPEKEKEEEPTTGRCVEVGSSAAEHLVQSNKEEDPLSQSRCLEDKLKLKGGYERLLRAPIIERKGRAYNNVSTGRVSSGALFWSSFGSKQREVFVRGMESSDFKEQKKEMKMDMVVGCELEAGLFNDMLDQLVSELLLVGTTAG